MESETPRTDSSAAGAGESTCRPGPPTPGAGPLQRPAFQQVTNRVCLAAENQASVPVAECQDAAARVEARLGKKAQGQGDAAVLVDGQL